MELELKDKIALVTGGSKGIGLAIAQELLNEGCRVCIMSRSKKNLEDAINKLDNKFALNINTFQGDISESSSFEKLQDHLLSSFGLPDIVINNAGGPPMGSLLDHDEATWYQAFDQGLMSIVRLSKIFSPNMVDQKWGRFVSVSSTVAIEPSSLMVLSASMRAGLAAFSKSASLTFAEQGITFNTICPGGVATDRLLELVKVQAESRKEKIETVMKESQESIPMKRFAEPNEIANLAVFLCSRKADYITGRVHSVDGGLSKSY
mgnify:CR=1 FL=1|jgi:3-oxoacyl-[acyl-carrier protein] reductase